MPDTIAPNPAIPVLDDTVLRLHNLDMQLIQALAHERLVGDNEIAHALRALARAILIERRTRHAENPPPPAQRASEFRVRHAGIAEVSDA